MKAECCVWGTEGEVDCGDEGVDWAPEVCLSRSGIIQGGSSKGREKA